MYYYLVSTGDVTLGSYKEAYLSHKEKIHPEHFRALIEASRVELGLIPKLELLVENTKQYRFKELNIFEKWMWTMKKPVVLTHVHYNVFETYCNKGGKNDKNKFCKCR